MAGAKKKQTWIFLLWVLVIIRCALFLSHKIIIPKQQTTTDDDNAWNIWRKTTDDFPCHNPGIKLPLQKNTTDGFPLRDKAFYTPGAFSNPSKIPTHGLLFIKPMKVGSSTATGINLRISKNVAERQHANFSICENSYDHSQGEYFRDRDIPNSFLWSFVRHPTKRAVSWFFHFVVSRKKIKPTISSFKKYTAMQKNYYLKLHKLTDANWKWANKTDQYYQNIIDDILQDYNFIGVTERFDESLVVLQKLIGVPMGDLLYFSAKVNGDYDDLCHRIQPTNVTAEMTAYLASEDWKNKIKWDEALYKAANVKLERTIEKLGRAGIEKNLATFQSAKKIVGERCQPRAKLPCDEIGVKRNANETNCLFLDSACAYDCIDEVANELGMDVGGILQR